MKKCKTCGLEKPVLEFYRARIYKGKQYYQPYCKKCSINYSNKYYNQNKEGRKKYQAKNLIRIYFNRKKWVKENRDKINGYDIKSRKKYPEKHQAGMRIRHLIKLGRIVRLPCATCQAMPTEAHHPDYSKPDKVIFLCRKHHLEAHDKVQRIELIKELQLGVIQH